MAVVVEELVVTLQARLDQYQFALNTAQRDTDRRLSAIEGRFDTLGARLRNSASGLAASMAGALGGISAAFGTQALVEYADAWTRVTRALDSSEQVYGIALANGEQLAQMATETRSNLEELSKLYIRTAAAAAKLGLDTGVAAEVTTTFAKALKLGQATTAEQTSAIGQFSQALQKGKLDGDEFRTIMESAGVVQQALIEKFKVSGATLIKMAADGKITAKDIIAALQQVKPQIDEAFGKSAATVSEAWENLRTAMTITIGKYNEANGVTKGLADGIQSIANNLETLVKAFLVVGAAATVAFAGPVVNAVTAGARAIAGAAAAGVGLSAPLTAAFLGLVAAYHATNLFGNSLVLNEEKSITLRDAYVHLNREVRALVSEGFAKASEAAAVLLDALQGLFAGSSGKGGAGTWASTLRAAVNTVIGAFTGLVNVVGAAIVTVLGVIPENIINLLNSGLRAVESFVKGVISGLNSIPGVKLDVDAVNLGEISNIFRGQTERAKALWDDASKAMSRDYVAEMGAAVDAVSKKIMDGAEKVANERQWKAVIKKPDPDKKPVYNDEAGDAKKWKKAIDRIKEQTEALAVEARAIGQNTAERERAAAMHDLLNDAKKAEIAITPQLLAQMDELSRAYGGARAQLELLQTLQRQREDTAAAKREIELVGLYGYELGRARIEAELLNDARRAGVALTPQLEAEIKSVAASAAAVAELRRSIDEVRDVSKSALSGFINDLREGKSGAEALAGAVNKIADKLIDIAANQLVEAALGGLLGGRSSGGQGGGLIGAILGFADGGVMTPSGPRALNKFAAGGVSRTAAVFAEAGPEAAVPLPDGRRIPVELRMPNINAAAQQAITAGRPSPVNVTVAPVFHVGGKVSAEDLASLETRVAKAMPDIARGAVAAAIERKPGFGSRGV